MWPLGMFSPDRGEGGSEECSESHGTPLLLLVLSQPRRVVGYEHIYCANGIGSSPK